MQWTFVANAHQHPLSVQLKSNLSSACAARGMEPTQEPRGASPTTS